MSVISGFRPAHFQRGSSHNISFYTCSFLDRTSLFVCLRTKCVTLNSSWMFCEPFGISAVGMFRPWFCELRSYSLPAPVPVSDRFAFVLGFWDANGPGDSRFALFGRERRSFEKVAESRGRDSFLAIKTHPLGCFFWGGARLVAGGGVFAPRKVSSGIDFVSRIVAAACGGFERNFASTRVCSCA